MISRPSNHKNFLAHRSHIVSILLTGVPNERSEQRHVIILKEVLDMYVNTHISKIKDLFTLYK